MHLYQCRSPAVRKLLQSGLDELEDKLRRRHMPSAMWTAIREGVESYCNATPLPVASLRGDIGEAARIQNDLGWGDFLKGRVSVHWGRIMGKVYMENPALRRCESKRRFVTTMIECLWDLYDALWKHRCELVHNNTDINALSVLEVDRRIRFLFDHKFKLFDSGDYDRFHLGLGNTLALPLTQKKAWVETLAQRQIATERSRRRLINKIKPITAYFDCIDKDDDDDED